MFKELFPAFKVNLLEPLSVRNKKLQDAKRIETQIQEVSGTVENSEPWIWEGSKVGKVNLLVPTHK